MCAGNCGDLGDLEVVSHQVERGESPDFNLFFYGTLALVDGIDSFF